jgi:transposase
MTKKKPPNEHAPKVRHYLGHFFMERKVKYDYTFKLECVELVLKKHYSDGYVKLKQIPRWNIRKWVGFYIRLMVKLVFTKNKSKLFAEFKLKVFKIIEISFIDGTGIDLIFPIAMIKNGDFANFGLEGLQPKQRQIKLL